MTNPLISQGTLNRLKASIVWNNNSSLNVTPSFLNKEGIRLSLDGEATKFFPTQTGAVTSPEPYMMITVTVNLLKTQSLSAQYKAQFELSTLLGDGVVRPDTSTGLTPYEITNCALEGVPQQSFNGEDPGWVVSIRGYYLINSSLWD